MGYLLQPVGGLLGSFHAFHGFVVSLGTDLLGWTRSGTSCAADGLREVVHALLELPGVRVAVAHELLEPERVEERQNGA